MCVYIYLYICFGVVLSHGRRKDVKQRNRNETQMCTNPEDSSRF